MITELDARILIRIPMATLVTSQTWIDTIVDYVSNEIEVWGRMQGSKEARKNGNIEALADAMRALKKVISRLEILVHLLRVLVGVPS